MMRRRMGMTGWDLHPWQDIPKDPQQEGRNGTSTQLPWLAPVSLGLQARTGQYSTGQLHASF